MKKIICLTIALCLIFGSFSFVFAAATEVSDDTTHTRLQTIITWLNNNAPTFNQINTFSSIFSGSYSGSSFNNYTFKGTLGLINDRIYSINQNLVTIKNSLSDSSGAGIATILSNILAEFTSTTSGGTVLHFFSRIDSNVSTTKSLVSTISGLVTSINANIADIGLEVLSSFPATVQKLTDLNTKTQNIYTLENNTLPGIYAYSGSIDTTLSTYQPYLLSLYGLDNVAGMSVLSGGSAITVRQLYNDGTLNDNTVNLSNKNWRDNVAYLMWNVNNNLTRGVSMTVGNYSDTQTRTSWLSNQQQTFTPTSFAKGVYYWLSSIQTPIARLAYVHASDQEIAAREKAASNQAALVTNFVDANGSGSVPTSSFGSLAGLSNSYKTNFSSDVAPTRIFDIFNSERGTWFSQETADQLDTTSSGNRSKSGSSFETPLLDAKINEIYEEIGVKK